MSIGLFLSIIVLIIFAKAFWSEPGLTSRLIAIVVVGVSKLGLGLIFIGIDYYVIWKIGNYFNNEWIWCFLGIIVGPGIIFIGGIILHHLTKKRVNKINKEKNQSKYDLENNPEEVFDAMIDSMQK